MTVKNYTPVLAEVKTIVRYHRGVGSWQAVNGTIKNFGSGAAGKRLAELEALAHDVPDVYEKIIVMAKKHHYVVDIVNGLIKAGQLLRDKLVFTAEVRSQRNEHIYYAVVFYGCPRRYECGCPHKLNGFAPYSTELGGRVCKHIWAVHIAYLLGYDLDTPPIPFAGEVVTVHGVSVGGIEVDF